MCWLLSRNSVSTTSLRFRPWQKTAWLQKSCETGSRKAAKLSHPTKKPSQKPTWKGSRRLDKAQWLSRKAPASKNPELEADIARAWEDTFAGKRALALALGLRSPAWDAIRPNAAIQSGLRGETPAMPVATWSHCLAGSRNSIHINRTNPYDRPIIRYSSPCSSSSSSPKNQGKSSNSKINWLEKSLEQLGSR